MFKPPHKVKDIKRYKKLVERMQLHGWQGSPLLADGNELLTGSHRFAAAETAGIDLQVVDVRELIPEWDEISTGYDSYDNEYKRALYTRLTKEQIQYYGLRLMVSEKDAQGKLPVNDDSCMN
jgi:hypothetical protein